MTPTTAKQLVDDPIFKAFSEGKPVQRRRRGSAVWFTLSTMSRFFRDYPTHPHYEYRVLPAEEDSYADLRRAAQNGEVIQHKCHRTGDQWFNLTDGPRFACTDPTKQYRVEPSEVNVGACLAVQETPADPYAALRQAHKEGKAIEVLQIRSQKWEVVDNPLFDCPVDQYRIADPYAVFKQALAEGKVVQHRPFEGAAWYDDFGGGYTWCDPVENYRIKPEEPVAVDPYAAFRAAKAQGKIIQFRWSPGQKWNDGESLGFTLSPDSYRIKPEPKYRAWTFGDFPHDALIRARNAHLGYWTKILGSSPKGLDLSTGGSGGPLLREVAFDSLLCTHEHSTDGGKTWAPCGVLEEVK